MKKRWICPECHQKEVERLDACGASSYFCNHCKQLISSKRIIEEENKEQSTEQNKDS